MHHLILGNGPAGVIAAETIRKHAPGDSITLVGDEPGLPYSRMAIPYVLSGGITEQGTLLRKEPDYFRAQRIDLRVGRASAVDAKARTVQFTDGSSLTFDRLLIATGAKPVRPPIPGFDLPCVRTCWTLADARAIMERAQPGARVLQVGAGFIGCIIMQALVTRGVQLTVLDIADRMVPRMMGEGAGGMIRRWVESKGITVLMSTNVAAIEPASPYAARLTDGRVLPVDLVVASAGVQPNIAFLEHSGIHCLRGIVTDERMQTSVPGIYAAGDCAEAYDVPSGKTMISAVQPAAVDEGHCAGVNMAGGKAQLPGVTQINVLDTLGLVSSSFGQWQGVPGGQHAELVDAAAYRYLRLEFDQDVLVGSNAIGLTDHVGILRGLTHSRVHLGPWKDVLMRDPLRLPEAYLASAQAQHVRAH